MSSEEEELIPRVCWIKKKKGTCPADDEDTPHKCYDKARCGHFMHAPCSKMMLDSCEIPNSLRPADESTVFCTKTCYTKWAKKQTSAEKKEERDKEKKALEEKKEKAKADRTKKPWNEDGSLAVLIDWITTEGNWSKFQGGTGNNGESKAKFHKDISILIQNPANCFSVPNRILMQRKKGNLPFRIPMQCSDLTRGRASNVLNSLLCAATSAPAGALNGGTMMLLGMKAESPSKYSLKEKYVS